MEGDGGLELREACDFLVSDLYTGENKGQETDYRIDAEDAVKGSLILR